MKGSFGVSNIFKSIIVYFLSLLLSGCGAEMALVYLPSLLPSAIQAGGAAIAGLENVDVKSAVSKGVTEEEIKKIKKLAVIIGSTASDRGGVHLAGGDIEGVMMDNMALELMTMGYEVIERSNLEKVLSEQKLQLSGLTDTANIERVGKILGIDALVICNMTTASSMQMSTGVMGVGGGYRQTQLISNASFKLFSVDGGGKVLMMVTLGYKKGQPPSEAARTVAIALSEKIKNPIEKVTTK